MQFNKSNTKKLNFSKKIFIIPDCLKFYFFFISKIKTSDCICKMELLNQSCYVPVGAVLMLWYYDNLLLIKLQKWLGRKLRNGVWEGMKLYTLLTKKNEMKKDGYHVDSVYLYIREPEKSIIRQYDMLRIFRDQIREEKLSKNNEMDIYDFIELCCDPNSNFKKVNRDQNYVLEVNYTFDYHQYKIFFDTNNNKTVRFPVYNESEIRNRDIMNAGITYAYVTNNKDDDDGIDITDQVKKFAGPMENFYDDCEYVVQKKWLVEQSVVPPNGYIKILDFKGDEHIFGPDDEILTFNKN